MGSNGQRGTGWEDWCQVNGREASSTQPHIHFYTLIDKKRENLDKRPESASFLAQTELFLLVRVFSTSLGLETSKCISRGALKLFNLVCGGYFAAKQIDFVD